ncbi:MAG: gamma-glutamyl-gamma-aminobutyrate hydrolase family protein [Burkholderiaceae bacterium]|nr:gamma-glutamyl-gamma-aminobutyrate hydrolase family protein [Burkholderiaceae bacterium]
MTTLPVVLVPACNRMLGEHPFHIAGRKYVDAVRLAGALPLVVPRAEPAEVETLLQLADGVLLTGSPSNVHPRHFDEDVHDPALPLDPARDDWTLPLIPQLLARGIPLLAICRGTQEVNVALGGTLHQAVHEVGPYADHRADDAQPAAVQYGPAHPLQAVPGGLLARIVGRETFEVNSVHGQAVATLAPGLRAEGHAPDGLVEAFTHPEAPGFNLCVQWHPEWRAAENDVSVRLFEAFGRAVRGYRDRVRGPLPGSGPATHAAKPTEPATGAP